VTLLSFRIDSQSCGKGRHNIYSINFDLHQLSEKTRSVIHPFSIGNGPEARVVKLPEMGVAEVQIPARGIIVARSLNIVIVNDQERF
jgi:hypothetical protein